MKLKARVAARMGVKEDFVDFLVWYWYVVGLIFYFMVVMR